MRYDKVAAEASGRPEGSAMTVVFRLAGQDFVALNGEPHFKFTPAISFFVTLESEAEVDACGPGSQRDEAYSCHYRHTTGAKSTAGSWTGTDSRAGRARHP